MEKDNKISIAALLVSIAFVSIILTPHSVTGASSTGEIRLEPSDVSLSKGEARTIAIKYDSRSAANPTGIEFVIEYNPEVISIVSTSEGGYITGGGGSGVVTRTGKIGYGRNGEVNRDNGTVATVTIKLANGVSQGATTDLTFTKARTIGTDSAPQRVDGTVEAAESTPESPQNTPNYNVQIVDPTLSPTTVTDASGTHTLRFNATEVSADNERDNFTVTLPDSVAVEDVTNTTITTAGGETVSLVGTDPATLSDPGNELTFAVNPIAATDTQTLTVEIKLTLSPRS